MTRWEEMTRWDEIRSDHIKFDPVRSNRLPSNRLPSMVVTPTATFGENALANSLLPPRGTAIEGPRKAYTISFYMRHVTTVESPDRTVTQTTTEFACFYSCGRTFLRFQAVENHEKYFHPKTIKFYRCTLCDFSTLHSSIPKRHLRMVHKMSFRPHSRTAVKLWFDNIEWINPDRKTPRSPAQQDELIAKMVLEGFKPNLVCDAVKLR